MEMEPIDGVKVTMAMGIETVLSHVRANIARGFWEVHELPDWRSQMPLALVGGGPSLDKTWEGLRGYKNVMACGSVHDHLTGLGIAPTWTVVHDPDPVMAKYLQKPYGGCQYLIASYCHEDVFKALEGYRVALWHPAGGGIDFEALGAKNVPQIGGGCTVATRAISLAMAFGFEHIHLFGMDTCVESEDVHHAYPFLTKDEALGQCRHIQLEPDGPKFLVPDYLVAQLFDFKFLIETYDGRLELRVAGGGLIDELLKVAAKARKVSESGSKE